ncbi:glycosyltransferase [Hyphobacterium sp.]|uniref:glycosyltransferase n=1 Tax=Hyphobacterium sp. TaxID=2004662 RepID=UPI003BA8F9E3
MTAASVSAIMVSWQTGPVLLDGLNSLIADPDIAEIILVDHENPEGLRAKIDQLAGTHDKLTVIRTNENLGFAKGCNLGAVQASSAHLFFINPDARPESGAVNALLAALKDQPQTAIAGARILDANGKEQSGSRRRELTLWRAIATFTGLAALGLAKPFGREKDSVPAAPVQVDAISGAGFAIQKAGFDALGGFDEAYFLHVEDIDLCRRAERVWFVPEAIVHHVGATSAASPMAVEWAKAQSFVRYFWKFDETLLGRAATIIVAPFLTLAILARAVLKN